MAENKIEVEYITTVAGALQAIEKLNKRLDDQENKLQKIGTTSKKSADLAAGSFNKLEQELKEATAALKGMTIGSADFDRQKKKVDALTGSLNKAKAQLKTVGTETGSLLDAGVGKLAQVAGGMQALNMLATALVDELEKAKQLRLTAAETTRSVEQSVAAMALNIGAANVPQAQAMIRQNAPELGVTQEGLANLLASAISGGAADLQEALKLSALTLKLTAGDAQKAAPIMSGMLSLAATTGNRNFEQVLGQVSQFQEAARGEDLATSINNMSTAMAAANARGERVGPLGGERTLELSSVISQVLQDPKMAVTGTTLRQMVQKLDAFVPKEEMKLDDGTVAKLDKQQVGAFAKLDTVDARIQAMRGNADLARQFLSTIENNEGKVAIRELVTGSERVKAIEQSAAAKITAEPEAAKAFADLVNVIGQSTQLTQAENKAAANIQQAQAGSIRAIEGQAQKIVGDTLEQVNLSGLDADTSRKIQYGMEAAALTGTSVPQAGIQALQEAQQQRRLFGVVPVGSQISAEDRALLDRQIRVLEGLERKLQSQQNVNVNVRPQAVRPKETPLPAATVP